MIRMQCFAGTEIELLRFAETEGNSRGSWWAGGWAAAPGGEYQAQEASPSPQMESKVCQGCNPSHYCNTV